MTIDLNEAEASYAKAVHNLEVATSSAADLRPRLIAGDETVTAADLAQADAEVERAKLLADAAATRLREVEDAQPLPAEPTVTLAPEVAETIAKNTPKVEAATKSVETASKARERAEVALRKAEDKLSGEIAKLSALKDATPHQPVTGLHLANLLVEASVIDCHTTVTSGGVEVPEPSRGKLPHLVIRETSEALEFTHLSKRSSEYPPDLEAVANVLALEGWTVNSYWREEPEALRNTADLSLAPTVTVHSPRAIRLHSPNTDRWMLSTGPVVEALGKWGSVQAGGLDVIELDRQSTYEPGAVGATVLYAVKVGLRIAFSPLATDLRARDAVAPLTDNAQARSAIANTWSKLAGQHSYDRGTLVEVKPLSYMPIWAGDFVEPIRRGGVAYFAEALSTYRVPTEVEG